MKPMIDTPVLKKYIMVILLILDNQNHCRLFYREAVSHSKGRESPLGAEREREFPATKVGSVRSIRFKSISV